MLISLGLILLIGMGLAQVCKKFKIPNIIGMLFTGIVLGPHFLNLLDNKILLISPELRKMALIVILIKAGLSLDIKDLKKVGLSAVLLSFLPASFEILAYVIFARIFLSMTLVEGAMLGAVMAAVSPAIVVPRMVRLMEEGYGVKKSIPQMILAGASCDDIFVLVLFSSFFSMAKGQDPNLMSLFKVPLSIIIGILLGALVGYILYLFFESLYEKDEYIRNTVKVIIILAISFILCSGEDLLKDIIPFSGLLAVVSMASLIRIKSNDFVVERLGQKFGKLWIFAEILLFVLVGAEVDISYMTKIGPLGLILIFAGLIFRSLGVFISVNSGKLKNKEKLFCIFSYLPKATVQAAIGSVALGAGLKSGMAILSMAVLGIIITAPLGAFLIDLSYKKFLQKNF